MVLTSLEQSLLVFKVLSDPNRLRLYWLLTHVGAAFSIFLNTKLLSISNSFVKLVWWKQRKEDVLSITR